MGFLLLLGVWISDITSEADFTLGCRRENKSSHAAYDWRNRQGGNLEFWIVLIKAIRPQTKPQDVEISLLPGDREGNEWGVVAFLLEVQKISQSTFLYLNVTNCSYPQPSCGVSRWRASCACNWGPKNIGSCIPSTNAGGNVEPIVVSPMPKEE